MIVARARCHSHFLSRAAGRGFCIGTEELLELERFVGELRPCFELKPKDGQPQKTRYCLSLMIAGARPPVTIVYDTRLSALVTIYP
tara:strand:+ start:125 stop:382 length:258 start_codon:yes stop_codon:yes gene_type:complete